MTKLFQVSALTLLAFVFSCNGKSDLEKSVDNSLDLNFPVLIDTFSLNTHPRTEQNFGISKSNILYIGKLKDTLKINYNNKEFPFLPPPPPPMPEEVDTINPFNSEFLKNKMKEFVEKRDSHPLHSYYKHKNDPNKTKPWSNAQLSIIIDTSKIVKYDEDSI